MRLCVPDVYMHLEADIDATNSGPGRMQVTTSVRSSLSVAASPAPLRYVLLQHPVYSGSRWLTMASHICTYLGVYGDDNIGEREHSVHLVRRHRTELGHRWKPRRASPVRVICLHRYSISLANHCFCYALHSNPASCDLQRRIAPAEQRSFSLTAVGFSGSPVRLHSYCKRRSTRADGLRSHIGLGATIHC